MFNTINTKKEETKTQRRKERLQRKEDINKQKQAKKILEQVEFTNVKKIIMRDNSEYVYLKRKDETCTFCFAIGGMALSDLNDRDFKLFYAQPLTLFLLSVSNAYFKFIEVPINFATKLSMANEQLMSLQFSDKLRKRLIENDIILYEELQAEKILQTLPLCFVDFKEESDLVDIISFTKELRKFNLNHLTSEQIEVILKYMNNSGTMIPAFDVL